MSHLCLITQKQKPPDFMSEGFFTPEKGVVPKVRVELTRVAPLVFEISRLCWLVMGMCWFSRLAFVATQHMPS